MLGCTDRASRTVMHQQRCYDAKARGALSDHADLLGQVFGPESSGKTTLAMHAIAEIQRQGGTAALIDAEHAFDPVYSGVSRRSPKPAE